MSRKHDEDRPLKPVPPDAFSDWWYPYGTAEPSGASVGGHPDAAECGLGKT
jgi:hypothetical protein